jgi:hypothetical protein
LGDVSQEQASYWGRNSKKRAAASLAKYTFPSIPVPVREDWNHLDAMHPWTLELASIPASQEVKEAWALAMLDLGTATDDGDSLAPLHMRIAVLHAKLAETGHAFSLPPCTTITSLVIPRNAYLSQ